MRTTVLRPAHALKTNDRIAWREDGEFRGVYVVIETMPIGAELVVLYLASLKGQLLTLAGADVLIELAA